MTVTRTGRFAWPAVLLASLFAATPLWTSQHLPPQDLPTHLSILASLARADEPGWRERFEDRRALQPYTAAYSPVLPLVRAVGAETTGRILLSLYVILLPLSLAALLHVWRPGTELAALLAVPLIYSDIYLMGFIHFLISLPLLFFALALGLGTLRGGARWRQSAALLCVLLLIACYTHPVSVALFALLAASWLVFSAADARRLAVFAAVCAPAGSVFALWSLGQSAETVWRVPALYKLRYLLLTPAFPLDAGGLAEAGWVLSGFVVVGVLLVVPALRSSQMELRPVSLAQSLRAGSPWLGLVSVTALYYALPFARDATVWVDLRLATVVWMMLFVCTAGAFAASPKAIVISIATVLIYGLGVHRLHQAYSGEAAPLFRLLEELPADARLLPILLDPKSDVIRPSHLRERIVPYSSPYTQFVSWYHLEKGGESPYMAFHHSMSMIPLALKSEFYRQRFGVGGAFAPAKQLAQVEALAPRFDFIILRATNLRGLGAVEEVASLFASAPPFYAFEIRR